MAYETGTLGAVREMLVDETGRFDLVSDAAGDDYSDNGANKYINRAQYWLSRKMQYDEGAAWLFKQLSSGDSFVTFTQPRFVRRVLLTSSSEDRVELEQKFWWEWREDYPEQLTDAESGTPAAWSPVLERVAPPRNKPIDGLTLSSGAEVSINLDGHGWATGDTVTFHSVNGATELNGNSYEITVTDADNFTLDDTDGDDFTTYVDGGYAVSEAASALDTDYLYYGDALLTHGIKIMPPADGTYTLEILCQWKERQLVNDTDRSFWTVLDDGAVLVRAAARMLEVSHRNTQGVADEDRILTDYLRDIESDMVNEEMQGPPERWIRHG